MLMEKLSEIRNDQNNRSIFFLFGMDNTAIITAHLAHSAHEYS